MGTTVRLDGTTPVAKEKLWKEELKPLGSAPVGIAVNPEGILVRPPATAEVGLAWVVAAVLAVAVRPDLTQPWKLRPTYADETVRAYPSDIH